MKAMSVQTLFLSGSHKSNSGGRTTLMVHATTTVCMDIIIKVLMLQGSHKRLITAQAPVCMGITIRVNISTRVLQCVWFLIRDFDVHLSNRPSGGSSLG